MINFKNLQKLLDGMKTLPKSYDGFDMRYFYCEGDNECGTSACLLGHGALFGIGVQPKVNKSQLHWNKYSTNVFGIERDYYSTSYEWMFLFGMHWSNDISHAINRLQDFIKVQGDLNKIDRMKKEYS